MERKHYFPLNKELAHQEIITCAPKNLYPQETDWTCSIACIRTMLSGAMENVPSEEQFVAEFGLCPGPHYSKDIKRIGILNKWNAHYGCDFQNVDFDMILSYAEQGYFIMLESMYNYAHWLVLLGYYPSQDGTLEKSKLLVYDPYYNQIRLLNADEFITMWIDGDHKDNGVTRDFIAIK